MQKLAFVLWLVMFPITCAIEDYIYCKIRKMIHEPVVFDKKNYYKTRIVLCFFYVIIAILIYIPW